MYLKKNKACIFSGLALLHKKGQKCAKIQVWCELTKKLQILWHKWAEFQVWCRWLCRISSLERFLLLHFNIKCDNDAYYVNQGNVSCAKVEKLHKNVMILLVSIYSTVQLTQGPLHLRTPLFGTNICFSWRPFCRQEYTRESMTFET